MRQAITATRRAIVLAAAALLAAPALSNAQDSSVRIGYAISRSGIFAAGAQEAQEPFFTLWAEQVNAAGGLNVKGVRRKVELVGYDDRSDTETAIRTYEKLISQDKVDLVLPPWGTHQNLAVAPLLNKRGYPVLIPTAISNKLVDMKLPYVFIPLQQAGPMMSALVDMLDSLKIKTVAVAYMDDQFGLECKDSLLPLLKKKGIDAVEVKSYPLGVKDLSPMLRSMKSKTPEAFLGITYPGDTLLVTAQSKEIGFTPKVFYTGVGTAFPVFRDRMGPVAENVMGMGSWNHKVGPGAKDFFELVRKRYQREPDRWASAHTWASLQILQQTIEKVGLDRKAIRDYIAANSFDTVIGPVRFNGSQDVSTPGMVMQWQKGEFEIVWPKDRATAPAVVPKT